MMRVMYTQPQSPPVTPKPVHKRWWFWLVVIGGIALVSLLNAMPSLGELVAAEPASTVTATETRDTAKPEPVTDNSAPKEHQSALVRADRLANKRHMSKAEVYRTLTSDAFGFPDESAQYAIENIDADWRNNALEKARYFQDERQKSHAETHRILASDTYGFTEDEADYAIANLTP